MDLSKLTYPNIKKAVETWQNGDSMGWQSLFTIEANFMMLVLHQIFAAFKRKTSEKKNVQTFDKASA